MLLHIYIYIYIYILILLKSHGQRIEKARKRAHLNIYICLATLCSTERLMDHYPWVWQTVSFSFSNEVENILLFSKLEKHKSWNRASNTLQWQSGNHLPLVPALSKKAPILLMENKDISITSGKHFNLVDKQKLFSLGTVFLNPGSIFTEKFEH